MGITALRPGFRVGGLVALEFRVLGLLRGSTTPVAWSFTESILRIAENPVVALGVKGDAQWDYPSGMKLALSCGKRHGGDIRLASHTFVRTPLASSLCSAVVSLSPSVSF